MYQWSDDYLIGEATIDTQHKMFMQYINDLEKAGDAITSYSDISAMIIFLQDYSEKHFTYEEQYMENNNYPYLDQHRAIHHDLTKQIDGFYLRLRSHEPLPELAKDVSKAMGEWLTNHIMTVDKAISIYLKTGQLLEI